MLQMFRLTSSPAAASVSEWRGREAGRVAWGRSSCWGAGAGSPYSLQSPCSESSRSLCPRWGSRTPRRMCRHRRGWRCWRGWSRSAAGSWTRWRCPARTRSPPSWDSAPWRRWGCWAPPRPGGCYTSAPRHSSAEPSPSAETSRTWISHYWSWICALWATLGTARWKLCWDWILSCWWQCGTLW